MSIPIFGREAVYATVSPQEAYAAVRDAFRLAGVRKATDQGPLGQDGILVEHAHGVTQDRMRGGVPGLSVVRVRGISAPPLLAASFRRILAQFACRF